MLFRTHVLFGLFVWFILDRVIEMPLFVLVFVLLGSVFVDIDSCKSKVGRKFWFLSWWMRHRGAMHSLVCCLILSLLVGVLNLWAGFGFFVGYISHLLIDCFTYAGIGLFWPFRFKVKGWIKSGGWVEDVVFVLLLLGDIGFGLSRFFG